MEYNGVLLLNKPEGPTSHDMIYEIRRIFGTKKVGHTGTLDPLATGVLPICIGNATKASDMLLSEKKEYVAEIKFGVATETGDVTGNIISTCDVIPSKEKLVKILSSIKGEMLQTPPMYSAKKVDGKKLYELARKGEIIEREPSKIIFYETELLGFGRTPDSFIIRVLCSKGTYIRVLCEDIGKMAGSLACMSSLKRTSSGNFSIDNSYTIDQLKIAKQEDRLNELLIPTENLFDYKKIILSEKQSVRMKSGVFVSAPGITEGAEYRVYDDKDVFFAIGVCIEGRLRIKKSFRI